MRPSVPIRLVAVLFSVLLSAGAAMAQATGHISANPNPCVIAPSASTCAITISWSVTNATSAKVTVQDGTGAETDFASGLSGSQNLTAQALPHTYTFRLYDTTGGNLTWLDGMVVLAKGTGTLTAAPNPCIVASGASGCSTTLTWSSTNVSAAVLTMKDVTANSGETVISSALNGSQSANLLASHEYLFTLYDNSGSSPVQLAATGAIATGSGGIAANPDPCPMGTGSTSCTSTITWSTQNVSSVQIIMTDSQAPGSPQVISTSLSGMYSASIQAPPHSYTFTVYDSSTGNLVWLASTGVVATGNGILTASPDPCFMANGSSTCNASVNWSTNNVTTAEVTQQDMSTNVETSIATGASGTKGVALAGPKTYVFRLYDTSSGSRIFLDAYGITVSGSGTVTASPNPCSISGGVSVCNVSVTWTTANMTSAEVTQQDMSTSVETTVSTSLSGNTSIPLAGPKTYTFRLYDTSSGSRVFVDAYSVVVAGSGTISESPDPCSIPNGSTTCNATVTWNTSGLTNAEVTQQDTSTSVETSIATGASGTKIVALSGPKTYIFRLYDTSSGSRTFLDSYVVTVGGSGTISATPSPCTILSGATTCTTTVSWSTTSVTSAEVTERDVAGSGESTVATSLSGSYGATLQGAPHDYLFTLYDVSTGNRVYLASWEVNGVVENTPATPVKAQMLSPAPGSILPGSTVTFHWTTGTGVTSYWLWIGNSAGSLNYYDAGQGTATSVTVSNLPSNSKYLYVRLFSFINGSWQYTDYIYTNYSPAREAATMLTPANGSTLTGPSTTFTWTPQTGATGYWMWIGSAPGTLNFYDASQGTNTSVTLNNLPASGQTLYVRLFSAFSGGPWLYNDYTYKAYTASAAIVSPTNGSALTGASATFTWTSVTGASSYWMWIGTSPGSLNLYDANQGTNTSVTVNGLPTTGQTLYVRLFTFKDGTTQYNDYTYKAYTPVATMLTPINGSHLSGSSVTFTWTPVAGASSYWMWIGTSAGALNLYDASQGSNTSVTVNGMPTTGQTLYVRLFTVINGTLQYRDYAYITGP